MSDPFQHLPQAIRSRLLSLPKACEPNFVTVEANQRQVLYEGKFELRQSGNEYQCNGKLVFDWFPYPRVGFSGILVNTLGSPRLAEAVIFQKAIWLNGPVYITRVNHNQAGVHVRGHLKKVAIVGRNRPIEKIEFSLTNFHKYFGSPVRFVSGNRVGSGANRLTFAGGGWELEIDQLPQYSDLQKQVKRNGGYVISHVGVARCNKKTYAESWNELRAALFIFFGFLRGFWVGPVLPVGVGVTTDIWQQWGSWRITPWNGERSWFPSRDPQSTQGLFANFMNKWQTDFWKKVLKTGVNWYVESNTGTETTEASIALTQNALEMLSWVVFVEDGNKYSGNQFDGFRASKKIRMLLNRTKVSPSVPDRFVALKSTMPQLNASDGPEAFVRLRNAIVHPKKSKRQLINKIPGRVRWEVKQLGLWYLELTLLYLLGYQGCYYSRVKAGTVSQIKENVPW